MKAFLVILLGLALVVVEFLGMTWLLKYSFTSFLNGNLTMLSCGILLFVLLWLGKANSPKKVS